MNKFLKSQILIAIANGKVISTSRLGSTSYVVYNTKGERLLSVNNDWDYGAHNLIINNEVVLFADKNGTGKDKPIDTIINEIVEICDACEKRYREQRAEQEKQKEQLKQLEKAKITMTRKEAELVNFLNGLKKRYTI